MRQGQFEVLVLRKNGVPFPQHQVNGKHYVTAEPNAEYKVKLIVHKNEGGELPYSYMKAKLHIDGKSVKHTKHVSKRSTTFKGYNSGSSCYQAFVFTEIFDAQSAHACTESGHVGVIKVIINEAVPTDRIHTPRFTAGDPEFAQAVQNEGKKFWEQPSLQTAPGGYAGARSFCPFRWTQVRPTPDHTLELYYHTKDNVNFLQDFYSPRRIHVPRAVTLPVHVDLSTQLAGEDERPPRAPEVVDLVEVGAKVKLENQDGTSASKKARATTSNGGVEVVDLTV